jgi:hypothetical protein
MTARNYRLAAGAALAGGLAWAVSGPLQLAGVNEHETQVVTFGEHVLIGLFSLALVLTAPGVLALARHARSDTGAKVAAGAMVLLALTATTSNVNGEDMSFFPAVATATNLLWLAGSIHLAVSLHKAGRVPLWVAIGLPLTQVFALPLSAAGGGLVAGGYWVTVAYLMQAGALENRSARDAAAVTA